MEKGKYILLLLFISFNILVGLSLLVKAFAVGWRVWWRAAKAPALLKPTAMAGNRALTNKVWRNQRAGRAIRGAI